MRVCVCVCVCVCMYIYIYILHITYIILAIGAARAEALRRRFAATRHSRTHDRKHATLETSSDDESKQGIVELSPEHASFELTDDDFPNRHTESRGASKRTGIANVELSFAN